MTDEGLNYSEMTADELLRRAEKRCAGFLKNMETKSERKLKRKPHFPLRKN